jgi:hypothetical protein
VSEAALLGAVATLTAAGGAGRAVPVHIVRVNATFSRALAKNAAYGNVTADEMSVNLDMDVRVGPQFFSHARAFSDPGRAAYFPIMFSRYNPAVVANFARFVRGVSPALAESLDAALAKSYIRSEVGMWRPYSTGMLASSLADAQHAGLFDENYTEWGMEDIDFYHAFERRATTPAARFFLWRAYDPMLQHAYHPKDCSRLTNTDRSLMCATTKIRSEGDRQSMGLLALQAAGDLPAVLARR